MTGFVNFDEPSPKPMTSDPGNPKSTRIPLPDYKNPESRLGYAKAFTQKYGPLMSGRGDTPLRINEVPAWGKASARDLSVKAAKAVGVDPVLLYTSAMEEGMSGLYPHVFKGREKDGLLVQSSGDKEFPIDGFISFGLDTFSDSYPELVKKGYLPKDFSNRFKPKSQVNELEEEVNSANFKSPEDALMAKAAMMRNAQDTLDGFVKKNNINLSEDGKKFFNLIAYNAGLGAAQKMLTSYKNSGFLKNDDYLKKRPSDSWKQPYENVMRRVQMASALKEEGYFEE